VQISMKPLKTGESPEPFRPWRDISLWSLLAANAWILIFYLRENWSLGMILWIYWAQSVSIGVVNIIRILSLKDFTTKGLRSNGQPVPHTRKAQVEMAAFFAFHYGLFHLIYAVFLIVFTVSGKFHGVIDLKVIIISSVLFFANHLFSFFYNRRLDARGLNLGAVLLYPYARIIPMHLILIFGFFLEGFKALFFFMVLKTGADLVMHIVEHRWLRKT